MVSDTGGKPRKDDVLVSKWNVYIEEEQVILCKRGWEGTDEN